MEQEVLLKIENVVKTYPGVQALKGITTTIKKGEVRALVGENGAGKSTLIKCIMGVESPTEGKVEINVDGTWKSPKNAIEAKDYGMHANYQNVNIAKNLSIAENYFLGRVPLKGKFVDWNTMYTESQKVIDKFQLNVNPRDTIVSLPVAMQAMITISKISVNDNIRLVIFDEPTALLENDKVETLFKYIRELKESGVSVIYVSHRLEEIMEICDSVTIMKDGSYVETKDIKEVDKDYLISKMVGRSMVDIYNIERQKPGKELLRVEHLSGDKFTDVSFTLREGEILGFFGLVGAGRTELFSCIYGLTKSQSGSLYLNGKEVMMKSPVDAIANGIGLVPEERRKQGMFALLSIYENVMMPSYHTISSKGVINFGEAKKRTNHQIDTMRIKTPSCNTQIKNLSGGNQQKVILGRWMEKNVDILILDEPTRGIDVRAKGEIYRLIREMADNGVTVIVISSEMDELISVSDRIMVMHEGLVKGFMEPSEDMVGEEILKVALK